MRKIIYLILSLVLFTQGCAFNKFGEAFGQAIVYDFEKNLFPDLEKLSETVIDFDNENRRWPNNYTELEKFAYKNKRNLQFNSIKNIEFTLLKNGNLAIDYDYTLPTLENVGFSTKTNRQRIVLKHDESHKRINYQGDQ